MRLIFVFVYGAVDVDIDVDICIDVDIDDDGDIDVDIEYRDWTTLTSMVSSSSHGTATTRINGRQSWNELAEECCAALQNTSDKLVSLAFAYGY